ncbi:MAG TPA: hypothetical protein VGW39_00445 [Chthoniobacterales bacterium]|nr:hypothetical protein [Chthoniobacterales bacterium]
MKYFLFAAVAGFSFATLQVQAATIKQTIASINADASKPGGPETVLKSISKSTGVPAATLASQKAKTGLSYGDIFAAHSIAKASGKTFDQIAALKAKGQSWDKIAEENNVSIGGQKTTKTAAAAASPSPSPMKTLAQEQRERLSQTHTITNAPPKPKPTPGR